MPDIGNAHVIDYYLRREVAKLAKGKRRIRVDREIVFVPDFDIETERREGWTYDKY